MKSDGEWLGPDTMKPELAYLFSTTFVTDDRDTGCKRAVAVPSKAMGAIDSYLVKCVAGFCDRLALGDVELKSSVLVNKPNDRLYSHQTKAPVSRLTST